MPVCWLYAIGIQFLPPRKLGAANTLAPFSALGAGGRLAGS